MATFKRNENWIFCEFSCPVVLALGSKYQYRSWLVSAWYTDTLTSGARGTKWGFVINLPCSWGRSVKDTNSSCSHKLFHWFFGGFFEGFVFSPLPSITTFRQSIFRERTAVWQTRPDFFCSMATWHVEFKISYCFFYTPQHLAAHMDWTQYL